MKNFSIALMGNPNVGKSTVFNALTGLNQHTGNWPGKTVSNASGNFVYQDINYTIYDLPGTYSLIAHSLEEEVARDFICFGEPDIVVVVCDAVCLERNLNLVLQALEITSKVVVCVNLLDEAKKKKIKIDLKKLSLELGVPVVGTSARSNQGIDLLMDEVTRVVLGEIKNKPREIKYSNVIEEAVSVVVRELDLIIDDNVLLSKKWMAIRLIDNDMSVVDNLCQYLKEKRIFCDNVTNSVNNARAMLLDNDIVVDEFKDYIVSSLVNLSEDICKRVVKFENKDYLVRDRKIDRFLTNKWTGIPIMIILLMGIFWLTISGANYPSALLFNFLFWIEGLLTDLFNYFNAPSWLYGSLVLGVYRVLAWVVSVMLPPMMIFFPLFTLLEDLGYLPRIAFNLDKYFKKCCACGKQALTMCMVVTEM